MGFRGEIELRRRADAADFYVIFRGLTGGDGFVRDVGDAGQQLAKLVVELFGLVF